MKHSVIETTMEKLARIYANKRDIHAVPGQGFATDGQTIWYVPMPDDTDEYLMAKTRHGFFHEKDHCVFTDFTDLREGNIKGSLHSIFNALEDTRIERAGAREWVGQKRIAREFLTEFVQRELNDRFADSQTSVFKKIIDLIYLRVREKDLGDLGIILPDKIQRIFEEKVGDLIDDISQTEDQSKLLKIAKKILRRMKDISPPESPKQVGNQNNQSQENQDGNEQGSSSGNQSQDSGSDGEDGAGDEDGVGDENGSRGSDSEDSDPQNEQSSGTNEEGDNQSNGTDGDNGSQSGSQQEFGDQNEQGEDSSGSVAGSDRGGQDDLEFERKNLAVDVDHDKQEDTVNDDISEDVERQANINKIYREDNNLKDVICRQKGDENRVRLFESNGRKMIGQNSSKLKRLFISMRAPKNTRMQRSGRLDLKRIWNDDTDVIFQKRQPGMKENTAVSLVIDNSTSMIGKRCFIASSLLTILAKELERIRIPFECMGFTTEFSNSSAKPDDKGVRHTPIRINLMKTFEEPYRKVRKFFDWPKHTRGTIEFPCVKMAGDRLSHRPETKKVLFILSDGCSGGGDLMMDAMIKYLNKLRYSGIKVVGFGIEDHHILNYIEDAIIISDASRLGNSFFKKLQKILLKEG